MAQAPKVVSVSGVSKRYGGKLALDGVSFDVRRGEFFGLFGPNGAGKSTLMKIMTGQITATSGKCSVLDIDPAADPVGVKKGVGIVPESESPPSFLTPDEFLTYVGRIRGVDRIEERVARQMRLYDLEEHGDNLCKDLSKGTRQKVMLASAMLHDPSLLFLDEPFINLDPIYQRRFKDELARFTKNGGTIILCSHILAIAQSLCTRMAIIDHGRIIVQGTMESLRESPGEDLESIFLRAIDRAKSQGRAGAGKRRGATRASPLPSS